MRSHERTVPQTRTSKKDNTDMEEGNKGPGPDGGIKTLEIRRQFSSGPMEHPAEEPSLPRRPTQLKTDLNGKSTHHEHKTQQRSVQHNVSTNWVEMNGDTNNPLRYEIRTRQARERFKTSRQTSTPDPSQYRENQYGSGRAGFSTGRLRGRPNHVSRKEGPIDMHKGIPRMDFNSNLGTRVPETDNLNIRYQPESMGDEGDDSDSQVLPGAVAVNPGLPVSRPYSSIVMDDSGRRQQGGSGRGRPQQQQQLQRQLQLQGQESQQFVVSGELMTNKRRNIIIIVVVVAVVIVAAAGGAGLAVALMRGSSEDTTVTSNETDTIDQELLSYFRGVIINNTVTGPETLNHASSPQNSALRWLVVDDDLTPRAASLTSQQHQKTVTRYTLVTLFYATGANSTWLSFDNWLDGRTDECEWEFVYCTDQEIKLLNTGESGNNLQGVLPSELRELHSLEVLRFPGNRLTGMHPDIGQLSNLVRLDVSLNRIVGDFPTFIYNLTNLNYLYLQQNDLRGTISNEISRLTDLRDLHVNGNFLEGNLENALTGLSKLELLDVGNNMFTGNIGKVLQNLDRLLIARLNDNRFSGNFTLLTQLPRLRELVCSGNDVTGTIPVRLATFFSLDSLQLDNMRLTGTIPSELGLLLGLSTELLFIFFCSQSASNTMNNAEILYLEFNRLTGVVPQELCSKRFLTTVHVDSSVGCDCRSCVNSRR